jgi:uncharacterized membrane protein affecting hemolysin expression
MDLIAIIALILSIVSLILFLLVMMTMGHIITKYDAQIEELTDLYNEILNKFN